MGAAPILQQSTPTHVQHIFRYLQHLLLFAPLQSFHIASIEIPQNSNEFLENAIDLWKMILEDAQFLTALYIRRRQSRYMHD